MLGMVSFYNPQEHTIIDGEIGPFCDRLVEHDPQRRGKLFVVRYNKLGVFCICEWLAKPYDVFVDTLNLGKSLGNFGFMKAQELRKRLFKPVSAEATCEAITGADSDYHHNLQDEDMEETERRERVAIGE